MTEMDLSSRMRHSSQSFLSLMQDGQNPDSPIPGTSVQSPDPAQHQGTSSTSHVDTNAYGGVIPDEREETDMTPCAEDRFRINNTQNQSTEGAEEEPCYHPEQIEMAAVLLERVEEIIFRNVHSKRFLSAYEEFHFIIYTANSAMLEEQTISRLCDPATECFPRSTYRCRSKELYKTASNKVWKFTVENIKHHNDLLKDVKANPDTLYLIVADEAHSAITKETTKKKVAAANNTFVNSWNEEEHPNVIVLQVTATPFNLLTKKSRIPKTTVSKPLQLDITENPTPEECADQELSKIGRKLKNVERRGRSSHQLWIDNKDVTAEYSMPVKLHHVRWSEQLLKRLSSPNGVVMHIQVPADHMRWLTLLDKDSYKTFENVASTDDVDEATEFLFQGKDGVITIHTVDKKWQLVVYNRKDEKDGKSRLEVVCRNMEKEKPHVDMDESFRMLLEYGEDIFQLEARMTKIKNSHGQTMRKSVKFNPQLGRLEVSKRDNTDENGVASLIPSATSHSFFIDTRR